MDDLCRFYFQDTFTHFFLFGFIGPLVSVVLIFLFRYELNCKIWLNAYVIFVLVNLTSCAVSFQTNTDCQIRLFGEVADDPGDVGLFFITTPIFFVSLSIAFVAMFFIERRQYRIKNRTVDKI